MLELSDLMPDIASQALAIADSLLGSLHGLYSAGMPNGLGPGELGVGAAAGAVAGGGAIYPYGSSPTRHPGGYDGVYTRRASYYSRDGMPYFPGSSPIPRDGVVSTPGGRPIPVDRDTGRLIYPPDGPDYGASLGTPDTRAGGGRG